MCGTSVGKSTGLSPALMLALGGMLDQPQKTGDQLAQEFIEAFKPMEPEPADYDTPRERLDNWKPRSKYTPHEGAKERARKGGRS